MNDALPLHF